MWIKPTIGEQRKVLTTLFEPPMLNLSKQCATTWSDIDGLDSLLSEHFATIPHCQLLYAIDKFGKQISSNVNAHTIDPNYREQDLSRRPYSVSLYPKRHFMLSSVYISQTSKCPCISAVQPVINSEQQFLGFVVADFDMSHLPLSITPPKSSTRCLPTDCVSLRYRPQLRVTSLFDQHFSAIQRILYQLISEYGVFHCILHYSSGQAILWQLNDPYQYRVYTVEQLLDSHVASDFSPQGYPSNAKISVKQVQQVLERFNNLRLVDDNFYLRSSSLNIMNGMIGLSFSYDGTQQYLPTDKFLSKDLSSWFGPIAVNAN